MRIIVNSAHQRFGGGVQVALSFVHECISFPENEYHIFVGPGVAKQLDKNLFPKNFKFYYFDFGVVNLLKTYKINKVLKLYEKKIKPDCIISTSGPSYFSSMAPQIIGYNLPLYIYPESPFVKGLSIYRKFRLTLKKEFHFYFFKRDANAFVAQTDDVKERVKRELKIDKVYTVTNTFNNYFQDGIKYPNRLPEKKKGQVRFLTVSAWYPHKNLDIIPKIIEELKKRKILNIEFVLTIDDESFEKHFNNKENIRNIINIGPVDPKECPSIYNECDIMFLPTLAECFSASYPEAMVMKKPIITTDLGFARSICGDAALFYIPKDPISAANKIEQLIKNKELGKSIIDKGISQLKYFDSASSRALKYLNLCKEVSKKK